MGDLVAIVGATMVVVGDYTLIVPQIHLVVVFVITISFLVCPGSIITKVVKREIDSSVTL